MPTEQRMNKFSRQSQEKLLECDADLQELFTHVLQIHDCTITEGFRGQEKQDEYYRTGKSKVKYPEGKHNQKPSLAIDVAPYPIDWRDTKRFYYFAGIVKAAAYALGIKIRWGGAWDGELNESHQFMDLVHFELER